ncbi:hypothetical protein [uncultured Nostoc sp.]|uniref:hypothetical protein n=1 Tax=uncultured Nostoc sp. TaxID=340711 RepID=UPI0035CBEF4D
MNLGVGWVEERNPTPTIPGFVGVSLKFKRHLLQAGKPGQRSGSPTYEYFIFSEIPSLQYPFKLDTQENLA